MLTRRNPPATRSDEGSILLSMLGVLVLGAITLVMLSATLDLQRRGRESRDWHHAISGGDAGVEQVRVLLAEGARGSTLTGGGVLGAVDYTWDARRVGSTWHVRSTGVVDGRSRVVEADLRRTSWFDDGIFAERGIRLGGGNEVTSYDSRTGAWNTGAGTVGTNGELRMAGSTLVDAGRLHGPSARCDGAGCAGTVLDGHPEPRDLAPLRAAISDDIARLCPGLGEAWVASRSSPLVGGTTRCMSSMRVDVDTELVGATADNPVVVYVTGDVRIDGGVSLNCRRCGRRNLPDSPSLVVYSTGARLRVGNHAAVAGAFAVPDAVCVGTPSDAHATLYGGLVCADSTNQGQWAMRYDEALLDGPTGTWDVVAWREELQTTTSRPG